MPYIAPVDRIQYEPWLRDLAKLLAFHNNVGHVNYVITRLLVLWLQERHRINGESLRYVEINDVLGVLAAVQAEFYRRVAAPFEDTKKDANGDCFDAAGRFCVE